MWRSPAKRAYISCYRTFYSRAPLKNFTLINMKIKAIIDTKTLNKPLMQMIILKLKNIIRTGFNKCFELIAIIMITLFNICKIIIIAWVINWVDRAFAYWLVLFSGIRPFRIMIFCPSKIKAIKTVIAIKEFNNIFFK